MCEYKDENLENPLVSIIIPTYNNARYIRNAIDSALGQSYGNIELIVIDDGSTDETQKILSEYFDRIKLISQENCGSARARNAGIENSRGSLIAFLDADDQWHSLKLQLQVRHLAENEEVGLVYNNWLVVDAHFNDTLDNATELDCCTESSKIDEHCSGWIYTNLLLDSIVHSSSALLRRATIERVGLFDETLKKGQDYDYWLRISRVTQCHKLCALLSTYRIHDGSVTQTPSLINYAALIARGAVNRWGSIGPDGSKLSRLALRRRLADIWRDFGWQHFRLGDREIAMKSFARSLKYTPWKLDSWRMLVRALATKDS